MQHLTFVLLVYAVMLAGCAGGFGPKSPLPEIHPAQFIPPAGREAPRSVLDIRTQRVGVIPAEPGAARADTILRLSNEAGDFADVFVYGDEYLVEAAAIGDAPAYRVESWGMVDGKEYGSLSYAFPNGMVLDVYDTLEPEIRYTAETRRQLELYWASLDEEKSHRTLIGTQRLRELLMGAGPERDIYCDWSGLKLENARYLSGEKAGKRWYRLEFAGLDGKRFHLPLPINRQIVLPLLSALKDQPVSIIHGYGRVDTDGWRYTGPMLYGVSALAPRPEPATEENAPPPQDAVQNGPQPQ